MEGKRLIEKIRLRNILSFGDKGEEIELQPINVIIGQNASGKSNFVDVMKLLRSLPQEKGLINFISRNGGINEWMWKGNSVDTSAEIDVNLKLFREGTQYKLKFAEDSFQNRIKITYESAGTVEDPEQLVADDVPTSESILQKNASDFKKWISLWAGLRILFSRITAYTDLQTNRGAELRRPQSSDSPNDFLEEDARNLGLVLDDLDQTYNSKDIIVEYLQKFYPRVRDYSLGVLGGTVQLFIHEENLEKPVSAMRLSDGTLRYLCLLAILCHPEPPPLICIEEPETGLHPDILPTIGELLIEASKRTQLIVTTHSDILVSSFSEHPEAVLVCEADEDGTHLNRLDGEKLKGWLKKYSLGDLWIRGEIGGTRW